MFGGEKKLAPYVGVWSCKAWLPPQRCAFIVTHLGDAVSVFAAYPTVIGFVPKRQINNIDSRDERLVQVALCYGYVVKCFGYTFC